MIRGLLFFRYVSVSRYIKKIADIISFTVTRHKKELFLNDGNSSFSYATHIKSAIKAKNIVTPATSNSTNGLANSFM